MAFLDNSGDIILDAVLTDIGRKRMAQGDFRISKFAIGDDEIDYGLYNKDHPSGSAYYDLEILQTPVLEAFTQTNANINYGLTSLSMFDLLYLPSIAINTKSGDLSVLKLHTNGMLYLTANGSDSGTTVKAALTTDLGSENSIMISNGGDSREPVLIETGINNAEITPTPTNQGSYINSKGLQDNNFRVTYDSRFIGEVLGPTTSTSFTYNGTEAATLSYGLTKGEDSQGETIIADFHTKNIMGKTNRVYYATDGTDSRDNSIDYSVIAGPRASFTLLGLNILTGIAQSDYVKYGKTGQTQGDASSSKQYDYIDTVVYINGITTNLSIQIPVRIIKFAAS